MEQYTIYCTPEQTKKAIELGAPIDWHCDDFSDYCISVDYIEKGLWAIIPTAEQMIGWLEGHEEIDGVAPIKTKEGWIYVVFMDHKHPDIGCPDGTSYPSRKEVTLAAIDAALDYLINWRNKK